MSFLSLNVVNAFAEDTSTTETESKTSDTKNLTDDAKNEIQKSDVEAPDSIAVQSLNEELQTSVAEGDTDATYTDQVEYVDVNGNLIENAPTKIALGTVADHKDLSITGKNYEFKSAMVNGKDCVYIGKYDDTVYYSTDGVIAIKLEEGQKLIMTYQEYYNITVKEDIPEGGVGGTITTKAGTVDTKETVRVNAGDDWNITITPAVANKTRYKISSVVSENKATITKNSGDEYKANYTIQFQKDDVVTISYSSEGVYRVNVKTTDNEGVVCMNTDKTHYSGGYINDFTFTEGDMEGVDKDTITLPVFHVISEKRIVSFQLNGHAMHDDTTNREVPVSTNDPLTVRVGTGTGVFSIQISLIALSGTKENNCNYGYQLKVKKISGEWEDLKFTPTYGNRRTQTLTLKVTTNGISSDEGAEVAVYNYSDDKAEGLEVVHDNDTFSMDPTHLLNRKQVKFIFAKAKPGYNITVEGSRTSGAQQAYPTYAVGGKIDELNEDTLGGKNFTNFDNNWKSAKTAAKAAGYTHFLVMTGEEGNDGAASGLDWDLYVANVLATGESYYVLYDKGNLPDDAVVSNMPESDVKADNYSSTLDKFGGYSVFGARNLNEKFKIGEGNEEPTCKDYKFAGWKLVKNDDSGNDVYQNGDTFTITPDNVEYADNYFRIQYTNHYAYRFVAQWEKVASRSVKVNHYLKAPNGIETLKKTKEGTIIFAKDNETVTALGKPEQTGTFSGYIFDQGDTRNELEKEVTNDGSTDTIELHLYYKPTVLTVSKKVTGYNLEPNKSFDFTIKASAPSGTNMTSLNDNQIFISKGADKVENLVFTDNQATFTLKKDESVEISCLPTGWTYTVTETDPGSNYKAKYKVNDSEEENGTEAVFTTSSTGNDTIEFTNVSMVTPPETGRTLQNSEWILLLIITLVVSAGSMIAFRKKKE